MRRSPLHEHQFPHVLVGEGLPDWEDFKEAQAMKNLENFEKNYGEGDYDYGYPKDDYYDSDEYRLLFEPDDDYADFDSHFETQQDHKTHGAQSVGHLANGLGVDKSVLSGMPSKYFGKRIDPQAIFNGFRVY